MTETSFPNEWTSIKYGDALASASNGIGGKQNKAGIGIPVSRIETIANETINFERVGYLEAYDPNKIPKHQLCKGDILFSHINSPAHLGKTALFDSDKELYHGINLLRLIVDHKLFVPRLFNYHCRLLRNLGIFSQNAQHAVNQSSLNQKKLFQFSAPLPPLAEQKVIADKLDTLLAQVESTKARLERIPQILKRFRQSVLAAAVSGRLTEEWRSKNKYSLTADAYLEAITDFKIKAKGLSEPHEEGKWLSCQLGHIFSVKSGDGLTSKNMVQEGKIPVYGGNGVNGYHDQGNTVEPVIVIGRVGFYCGSVHRTEAESWVTDNALIVSFPHDLLNADFAYWLLKATNLRKDTSSSAQPVISGTKIYGIKVALPPVEEQTEIVRRVDQLFAHADRIEQQVNTALARVNNLTQSILAKAFRGELTDQWRKDNPELISGENSAEALLKRIKAERAAIKPAKKTRKQTAA